VSAFLLIGYGTLRFVAEYFREPDAGARHLRTVLHRQHGSVAVAADDRGRRGDAGLVEESRGQAALRNGDCIVNS